MVLATQGDFPATAQREWYQFVLDSKVDDLQIRPAGGGDKPDVEVRGTGAQTVYRVTGVLTANNQLVLPGGRFALRDGAGLQKWLNTLRTDGPARAAGAPRQPFNFSTEQLAAVHKDLSKPFDFSTKGTSVHSVLDKLGKKLDYPLLADKATLATITSAERVADELNGISAGTALSCALRPAGLMLVPRLNANRQPEYLVTAAKEGAEAWPVGWPSKKPDRDVLPGLFEVLNVEVDDVALSDVLEAIGVRIKAPLLFDHNRLARQGIDVTKVKVSLPAKQTMYAIALRSSLFKAGLKYELRVDEADKPFLWITTDKR
jgi:hypothetical protein